MCRSGNKQDKMKGYNEILRYNECLLYTKEKNNYTRYGMQVECFEK